MIENRHIVCCSERSLNLTLSLVNNAPNKKLDFPVTNTYKNGNLTIIYYGEWDNVCFLILDYITTCAVKKFYDKYNCGTIPSKPYKCKLIENYAMKSLDDTNNPEKMLTHAFTMNERFMRDHLQFKNIHVKKFRDALNKMRDTKFTFEYAVRFITEDGKFKNQNVKIINESILNYEILEDIKSPSGKITDRKYWFSFNSLFGKLIMYNCIVINIDWFTEDKYNFYKLKPKSQLFYRKYILPNRREEFEKRYDDCNLMLNFGSRKEYYKKDIIKCLHDMKKFELIESYEIGKNSFLVVIDSNRKM